jgi:hypothetical protein
METAVGQTFVRSALALALAGAFLPSQAQTGEAERLKALEQKLEASLRTIEALNQRLSQLEQPAAAAAPAGGWGARLDTVERTVTQLEAAHAAAAQVDTGLPIHGFADVQAGVRNPAAAQANQGRRGFGLGVFDLYMAPQITNQVKALIELAFEYGPEGELGIDLERLQLGYVFSDALTLWAGRFHTPYGYWNTAFHHGAQLQTTLARPRFLEFEDGGGILPAHSVGLWANGGWRTSAGKLGYDAYVVNGDAIKHGVLDYQASGDGDANVGVGGRLQLAVAGTGWTVGVHGLTQRVAGDNAATTASGRVRLGMLGGFATFDNDDWEAMGEFYRFRNRDLGGNTGTHGSTAWYVQLGRNVGEQFTPYVRLERAALDGADPYFALQDSGRSYRRAVAGVRFNVSPKAALKAEYQRTTEDGTAGVPSTLALQYAVRF